MKRIVAFVVAAALAALVLAPSAFAGDQTKLQVQAKDGSGENCTCTCPCELY